MKLARGDRGPLVKDVQEKLLKLGFSLGPTAADGSFGERTEAAVKEFQRSRGLPATGVVDEATYRQLVFDSWSLGDRQLYLHAPFLRGRDVLELQKILKSFGFNPGPLDGIYGPLTEKALREFQKSAGLNPDGIVGAETLKALEETALEFRATSVVDYPERRVEAPLAGRFIGVDAGHGGSDPGAIGPRGTREAELTRKVAEELAQLLTEMGAEVAASPACSIGQRVSFYNEKGVDVLVSVHFNAAAAADAQGTEVLYYGRGKSFSRRGRRLAELIYSNLLELLQRPGRGIKPRSDLALLARTRMPAVIVEPLFLSHPEEEKLALLEETQRRIAIGIARGLLQYFRALKS